MVGRLVQDGKDVIFASALGKSQRCRNRRKKIPRSLKMARGNLNQSGRGGLGNEHFKTSTNSAPHFLSRKRTGIEEWINF